MSANIAGVPGISVPCGFIKNEGSTLPVGLQFMGKHFGESTLLRIAHVFEQATEWYTEIPKI